MVGKQGGRQEAMLASALLILQRAEYIAVTHGTPGILEADWETWPFML